MSVIPLQKSGYSPAEEKLLRQLGVSVAMLWHRMPAEVRTVILNQAEINIAHPQARESLGELRDFLEEYMHRRAPAAAER